MENARTISEIKSSFIRNQVRILSAAIEPQAGWRDYAPETEDELSEKIVEEALQKLNSVLKQHNRVVYSTQAIHHISRQIESLYWDSVKSETTNPTTDSSGVEVGSDISSHSVIDKLPSQYPNDDISSENRERYERLYHRLVELDNIRRQQRQRLAQYKQLETLIEPLKDPQANIQPNLITRDSELVQEIDRMRMLVARVAGRVSQTRVIPLGDRSATIPSTDPDQKLAAVLDMT